VKDIRNAIIWIHQNFELSIFTVPFLKNYYIDFSLEGGKNYASDDC